MLRHWIQHIALNAARPPGCELTSALVGRDVVQHFAAVDQAAETLSAMLELYWRGLSLPLEFFPETSLAFVEAELKQRRGEARKEPLLAALQVWEGDSFGHTRAEKEDGYFDLCFRNAEPLNAEFEQTARAVFGLLLDHMKDENP